MADEFSNETDSREPYCRRHRLLSPTFTYKTPRFPPMVGCSECRNNKSFLKNSTVTFSYFSPLATSILQKLLREPVLEKRHMRLVIHWRSTFTRGLGGIGTRWCDVLWRSMELEMFQSSPYLNLWSSHLFWKRTSTTSFCDKVNCLILPTQSRLTSLRIVFQWTKRMEKSHIRSRYHKWHRYLDSRDDRTWSISPACTADKYPCTGHSRGSSQQRRFFNCTFDDVSDSSKCNRFAQLVTHRLVNLR